MSMDEQRQMLADAVGRLFRDRAEAAAGAEAHTWPQELWHEAEELGLPLLLVPEAHGGIGGSWDDAYVALYPAGQFGIPLPLGEAMLAARLAADAGLELPAGAASVAPADAARLEPAGGGWRFSGRLAGVPWGRHVAAVATVAQVAGKAHVVLLKPQDAKLHEGRNLAGEPRDALAFDNAAAIAAPCAAPEAAALLEHCALIRLAQIVGALEASLLRSIEYARERKQFGKAIGQFQAVQQQLALFGAEAAAVSCAARGAFRAAASGDAGFQIAAAKLRANIAIGLATATAHQVHAAIGFTREHGLHRSTQRLWSWRSEYGNDQFWSDRLGAQIAKRGPDAFWSDLTARDDAIAAA
ncbi:MAG: acyl-CoA/acyl-ACP dehydrogenase [Nevskia sp.]|nr:acyl-CoA/acyl-ACP dehydrogenase [Nevskia sp.]